MDGAVDSGENEPQAVSSEEVDSEEVTVQQEVASVSDAANDKVNKLNRLLAVAKRSIDDLKKKLSDKEELCERQNRIVQDLTAKRGKFVDLAKRAQTRITELEDELRAAKEESELNNDMSGGNVNKATSDEKIPVAVVMRVNYDGLDYLLTRFENRPELEWTHEDTLYTLLKSDELPFELPEECLSIEESQNIMQQCDQLQEELTKTQDNFRRYRVRSEIMRKQKEADLDRMADNNLKYQQHNIVGVDLQSELKSCREQIENLCKLNSDLEKQLERSSEEKIDLCTKLQEAQITESEWKKRFEQAMSKNANASISASSPSDLPNNDASVQYSKLKREYDNYRKRAVEIVEMKEKELKAVRDQIREAQQTPVKAPPPPSEEEAAASSEEVQASKEATLKRQASQQNMIDVAYLRNIVIKYMASSNEEETRNHMEAAIATVLRFSPEEMDFVKQKRVNNQSLLQRFW